MNIYYNELQNTISSIYFPCFLEIPQHRSTVKYNPDEKENPAISFLYTYPLYTYPLIFLSINLWDSFSTLMSALFFHRWQCWFFKPTVGINRFLSQNVSLLMRMVHSTKNITKNKILIRFYCSLDSLLPQGRKSLGLKMFSLGRNSNLVMVYQYHKQDQNEQKGVWQM